MSKTIVEILSNRYSKIVTKSRKFGIDYPEKHTFISWMVDYWENNKDSCPYCHTPMSADGKKEFAPSIDHIIPISRGGQNTRDNMIICHTMCNLVKGTMDYDLFIIAVDGVRKERGCSGVIDFMKSGYKGALAYKIDRAW